MEWLYYVSYFLGGVCLISGIQLFISGVMGYPIQNLIAKRPGQVGFSATANVIWGFINIYGAYSLTYQVGNFDLHALSHFHAVALGAFLAGIIMSRSFRRSKGANSSVTNEGEQV